MATGTSPDPKNAKSDRSLQVFRASFKKAFTAWSGASVRDKRSHLLTGPMLSQAENYLLTYPDKLTASEKRLIVDSISAGTGRGSRAPQSPARRIRRLGIKPFIWMGAAAAVSLVWVYTPIVLKRTMEASLNSDIPEHVVAAAKAPPEPVAVASGPDVDSSASHSHTATSDPEVRSDVPRIATATADPGIVRRLYRERIDNLVRMAQARKEQGQARVALLVALEAVYESAKAPTIHPEPEAAVAALSGLFSLMAAPGSEIPVRKAGSPPAVLTCANGVAFVSLLEDGRLHGWRPGQAATQAVLAGRPDLLQGASVEPGCERIALASHDFDVEVWSTWTGQKLSKLIGHEGDLLASAFSPDGTLVATASQDGTARVWDGAGRRARAVLRHDDAVVGVAFSADGSRLLTASADKTARLWDVRSGRRIREFTGHQGTVTAAAFSPGDRWVMTVSNDGLVRLWDLASEQPPRILLPDGSSATAAAFSPDGSRIAVVSQGASVQIWEAATGQQQKLLKVPSVSVRSVVFSKDAKQILTTSWTGDLALWDLATGQMTAPIVAQGQVFTHAAFDPDGGHAQALAASGTIVTWPIFPTLSSAALHAAHLAGPCLAPAEREELGLNAETPAWCKDDVAIDLDAMLAPALQALRQERETASLIQKITAHH